MEQNSLQGTVIYYGCPAEEEGMGKVHMIKKGIFDGLDLCLNWHPSGNPLHFKMSEAIHRAYNGLIFKFHGTPAHADMNPFDGRSALDAAELMNVGVQFLREHVPSNIRINYSFLNSSGSTSAVPHYAVLKYAIRASNREETQAITLRVQDVARGAALMTGCDVDWELEAACSEYIANHTLNQYAYEAACKVTPPHYTREEESFGQTLYQSLFGKLPEQSVLPTGILPLEGKSFELYGSTNISYLSHIVPTLQIDGTGVILGGRPHHWSTTACVGTSIGHKGMLYGSQVIAQLGYDVATNPELISKCWEEFYRAIEGRPAYKVPL